MMEDNAYDAKPFHLCWNSSSKYMCISSVNKAIANVK